MSNLALIPDLLYVFVISTKYIFILLQWNFKIRNFCIFFQKKRQVQECLRLVRSRNDFFKVAKWKIWLVEWLYLEILHCQSAKFRSNRSRFDLAIDFSVCLRPNCGGTLCTVCVSAPRKWPSLGRFWSNLYVSYTKRTARVSSTLCQKFMWRK